MGQPQGDPSSRPRHPLRWEQKDQKDDFYCLRYGVWYPSFDCAIRTRFRTAPGCLHCEQGRFNLKRHAAGLAGRRFPVPPAEND